MLSDSGRLDTSFEDAVVDRVPPSSIGWKGGSIFQKSSSVSNPITSPVIQRKKKVRVKVSFKYDPERYIDDRLSSNVEAHLT